jgi:hypothetical protein
MFDGLAIPEAHEMHMSLLKGTTGRRDTLEGTEMRATHGHTASHGVPFGYYLLNGEMQIWESRAAS